MKKLVALIVIIAICVAAWSWRGRMQLRPVNPEDQTSIVVRIPSGASTASIADILEENGVVRSADAFERYVISKDIETSLQAGSFVLKPSMTVDMIIESLTGKVTGEAVVTIPEGYTVKDIDALLAERGLTTPGQITECARTCDFDADFLPPAAGLADRGGRIEGYLFPDTYFVVADAFSAQDFLQRLLDTFKARVVDDMTDEIEDSGRSLHDIVTMASLIEEETRTDDERAIVSGILWKRLDDGMGLGVDAAVRYIINKPTAAITTADLNIDSPYNLRKFRGLPPGPIANAGINSIEAAISPKSSQWWYYLHGTDGQIRYAETNEQHNANRAQYIR